MAEVNTDFISDYGSLTDEHINKIIGRGIVVTGNIGCGKSDLAKYITKRIVDYFNKNPAKFNHNAKVRIFDIIHNWRFNFSEDAYYWFIDETTRQLALAPSPIIYDLELDTVEDRIKVMQKIVEKEFRDNRLEILRVKSKDYLPTRFYVIEEANVVFTTSSINKGFWLDFVSIARNFGLTGLYIMQRLADSSPKITERCANFAFGQTRGSNDLLKIRKMMDKDEWMEHTPKKLQQYEFTILIDGNVFKFKIPTNLVNKELNIFKNKEAKPVI